MLQLGREQMVPESRQMGLGAVAWYHLSHRGNLGVRPRHKLKPASLKGSKRKQSECAINDAKQNRMVGPRG